jgi:hypothetical protein
MHHPSRAAHSVARLQPPAAIARGAEPRAALPTHAPIRTPIGAHPHGATKDRDDRTETRPFRDRRCGDARPFRTTQQHGQDDIDRNAARTLQPISGALDMRTLNRLVVAGLLAAVGSLAMAEEAVPDSSWMTPSTLQRADLRAQTEAALRDGSLPRHESSAIAGTPASSVTMLTREQVSAEARAALRFGLPSEHEVSGLAATPSQLEQMRVLGLRASAAANAGFVN